MLVTQDNALERNDWINFGKLPEPLRDHLERLSRFIDKQVNLFEPEIRKLVHYSLGNTGKRIRPIFAFYSGWPDSAETAKKLVYIGTVLEFIHLATLIHDDVIDEATLRHNRSTTHVKYGTTIAVLLGDALLAQALDLTATLFSIDISKTLARCTRQICAGEISQTLQRGGTSLGLDEYYRVIDLKTAGLFEVSCQLGAQVAHCEPDYVKAVSRFGHHFGVAYQILDDLIDFWGNERQAGKTLGTDLARGKVTLPLLLLLEKLNPAQKKDLLNTLRKPDTNSAKQLVSLMNKYSIFEEAGLHFQRQIDTAESALSPFEDYPGIPHLKEFSRLIRAKMSQTVRN